VGALGCCGWEARTSQKMRKRLRQPLKRPPSLGHRRVLRRLRSVDHISSVMRGGQRLTAPWLALFRPSVHRDRGRHRRVGRASARGVSGARAWPPRAALWMIARALQSTESATRTLVGCAGRTYPHRPLPMASPVPGTVETFMFKSACALGLYWAGLIRAALESLRKRDGCQLLVHVNAGRRT